MKNNGFSLIQLMIIIVIVSILATIAIPNYNRYLIRSKVTRMLNKAATIQLIIENDILEPNININQLSSSTGNTYNGEDFLNVTTGSVINNISINNGIITIVGKSAQLGGKNITLIFTPNIINNRIDSWTCTNIAADSSLIPSICR